MSTPRQRNYLLILFTGFLVFCGLVFYNYSLAQKAIRNTKPSPLTIEIISFSKIIKAKEKSNFIWQINSSPDLSTTFTTIYWGYESTPSALTKLDSPAAVAYSYSVPDYTAGSFQLPEKFDVNILFPRPGQVWFRAYANIRGEHLWSSEKSIQVE